MTLKGLEHVSVVGDTTAGGLGNNVWRELVNGWNYRMTISLTTDKNGISFEGTGIPPDEVVWISKADSVAGTDTQIEMAIELIR